MQFLSVIVSKLSSFGHLSNDSAEKLVLVLVGVGLLYFSCLVWRGLKLFAKVIYSYWLQHRSLSKKFQRYGKWAIVTGCTDGIGKEYALQLAAARMNLVLISRSAEKLCALQLEIESSYQVDTKIIAADFGKQALIYDLIRIQLRDLDIGILVNNVGTDFQYLQRFGDTNEDEVLGVLNCNTASVVMLTHIVLPIMVRKRRGLIINVGSVLGLVPMPLEALYSATKAFVDYFTQAIAIEYEPDGIDVQMIMPAYVATKLSGKSTPSLFIRTPQAFVRTALNSVGRSSRCCGCTPHELQSVAMPLVSSLPNALQRALVNQVAKTINAERRAYAKKLSETAGTNETTAAGSDTSPKDADRTSSRSRKNQK